jgi:hypothetical protein
MRNEEMRGQVIMIILPHTNKPKNTTLDEIKELIKIEKLLTSGIPCCTTDPIKHLF